jgi:putative ABC transport system ATP-binding protein
MPPVIEIRNLSKSYRTDGMSVLAADRIDLGVEPGEFAVLAGPSGSGKTTLLNLAGGLDTPDEGSVTVDGVALGGKSPAELARLRLAKIGYIFQAYNLVPVLTAGENAGFVLMLRGVPVDERRRRVAEIFAEVGLAGYEGRFPHQMSGGQRQRVAVARAIAAGPAIVLADEPTANLDTESAFALLDVLEDLNHNHGMTFLFSSHDQRVIDRAHRIIRMTDGRIVSDERVPGR